MAKAWSKKEEVFLKKHYKTMSNEKLAKKFGVSPEAIRKKEKRLGLVREHPRQKKKKKVAPPVSGKWTEAKERYLKQNYLKKTNAELAKRFRTTSKSVEKKLWRMGLKRKGKAARSSEEERKRKIEEFLRERRLPAIEEKTDEHRSRAVVQFDLAMQLYYEKKYRRAEKAFEKIIKNFGNLSDIVYKAKQYVEFCLDKK